MATRKTKSKKTKKSSSRRRRVGATAMNLNPASPMVQLGSAAVGFFLADKINPMVDKVTGTMDKKIVGAIEVGLGGALVLMKLGKKKTMVEVVAGGIVGGAGIKRLLREFGVINGIGGYSSVPVIGRKIMNGYGKVPVLGYTPNAGLNGVFNGYNVPPVPKSQVMGSTTGSGLLNSGYME